MKPIYSYSLVAVFCGIFGFLIGRSGHQDGPAPANSSPPTGKLTALGSAGSGIGKGAHVRVLKVGDVASGVDLGELETALERLEGANTWREHTTVNSLIFNLKPDQIEEAAEIVRRLENGTIDRIATRALLTRWGEFDPEAALAYLEKPDVEAIDRTRGIEAVFSSWFTTDLFAATNYVEKMPEGADRAKALGGLASALRMIPPKEALAVLERIGDPERQRDQFASVVQRWGKSEPRAACEWVMEIEDEKRRGYLAHNVISDWVRKDSAAYLDFAKGRNDAGERTQLLQAAVYQLARSDPDAFVDQVRADPDQFAELELDLFKTLGSQMIWSTRESIDKIMLRLADEERAAFLTNIAVGRMHQDPEHAALLVAQMPADTPDLSKSMRSVLNRWAMKDLPAATQWLTDLPAGQLREAAVEGFALATVRNHPESAADWAASLAGDSHRAKTVSRIVGFWLEQDRAAAEAWLSGTVALSDERKAELLATPQSE